MSNSLFGVDATRLSDPQGQGANVVSPATANPLGSLIQGIGDVVSIFSANKKQEKMDADQTVLNNYSRELNKVADATSSGQLDPKEANVKAQQIYQNYAGTIAPHLANELTKVRDAVFKGSALSEAEYATKLSQDLETEAIKSYQAAGGYVSSSMSKAERSAIVKAEAVRKTEQEKWNRFRQEQEEKRASGRYSREEFEAEEKRRASETINELASSQFPAFNASMEALLKDVDKGLDWKTAASQQNALFGSLNLRLKQVAGMNPQLAENWGKVLEESNAVYKRLLNPETRASVSKAELDDVTNKAKLLTFTKSTAAQRSFLNNYFAPGTVATMNSGTETINEIAALWAGTKVDSNTSVPSVVGDKETSKPVISNIMTNMKNVYGMKDGDPKKSSAIEGMQNHVNNLLVDIYKAGSNEFKQITPSDLNDASVVISSPEFGKMVKDGLVNNKAISAAQRVLAIQYNQPILNEVSRTLSSIQSQLKNVNVVYQDGQVMVVGKTDTTRSGIQQDAARQQGADLSKAIDRVVKMNANLEGQTDYKKYWEENKHLLLPTLFKAPEGDVPNTPSVNPKSPGTTAEALQREYDNMVKNGKPSWISQEGFDSQLKIIKDELNAVKGKK